MARVVSPFCFSFTPDAMVRTMLEPVSPSLRAPQDLDYTSKSSILLQTLIFPLPSAAAGEGGYRNNK
jgi:hypothetical protein